MNKKVCIILSAVVLCALLLTGLMIPSVSGLSPYALAVSSADNDTQALKPMVKDETVYGLLNHDGSVASVYVVNHFTISGDGTYVDYGRYERIESLSDTVEPVISDKTVQWNLKKEMGDFYYKGTLSSKALPWLFAIQYTFNGSSIDPQGLAGKTGQIGISLSKKLNEQVNDYFKKNYAMQIQLPINLENSRILEAQGAVQGISGHTATLTYTVLPGVAKTYDILLEAEGFEMDSITIGLSKMDYTAASGVGDMLEGFDALGQGADQLVDGITALQAGMTELADGVGDLNTGMNQLSSGGTELTSGMETYARGLARFLGALDPMSRGSEAVNAGLKELSLKGIELYGGYAQLAEGIKAQLPGDAEKAQLKMMAQMAQSPDPAQAQMGMLAQSMLDQIEGLEKLSSSLTALNQGLQQYAGGVTELSGEYKALNTGVAGLAQGSNDLLQGYQDILDGSKTYTGGVSQLAEGLLALSKEVAGLPKEISRLVDGQKSLSDGIHKALRYIDDMMGSDDAEEEMLVSFVDPESGFVSSVQFILRTPSINLPERERDPQEVTSEQKGFIEKLFALFR